MKNWIVGCLAAAMLGTLAPLPAAALDATDKKRIERAIEDLLTAAAAIVTRGRSVRGASGSISTLLQGTDAVFCAGWQIHYNRIVVALERERALADAARQRGVDLAHQRLRTLQNVIERACDRALNPEAYESVPADVRLPDRPGTPTANCDANCQRLRAAYFAALSKLWDLRHECQWLDAMENRVKALPLAIRGVETDLARSRRERDTAKRLYDLLLTPEYMHKWNFAKLEIERLEGMLARYRAHLRGANLARLQQRQRACAARLRRAEAAKDTAAFAYVGRTLGEPLVLYITTTTGTATDANSDLKVYISLNGSESQRVHIDNPDRNDLEKGNIDTFRAEFNFPAGRVRSILLEVEGDDAWYAEKISFRFARGDRVAIPQSFTLARWFSADTSEGTKRMSFNVRANIP